MKKKFNGQFPLSLLWFKNILNVLNQEMTSLRFKHILNLIYGS